MLEVAGRVGLDDSVAYVLPRAADRSWYPGASTTRCRTTSRG